jgi:putative molybdopterin biosynthesis protein
MEMEMEIEPTITTGQFARAFGVSPETVRGMIKRGELRGSKVGKQLRIPASEQEKYRKQVFGVVKQEQLMAIVERNVAAAFNEVTEDGAV